MSFLRARQRTITALFPHQGNRTHLIPKRRKIGMFWSTIPAQSDTVNVAITPLDTSPFLNEPIGVAAAIFSATGLPTGLNIATDTGIISGTPTVINTFNPVITATNAFESVDTTFQWDITA